MIELREGFCFPRELFGVNVGLALVDGVVAALAFAQLLRIHLRNRRLGWTRQKVFHMMIGSSNIGSLCQFIVGSTILVFAVHIAFFTHQACFFIYFVLSFVAACKGWKCWSSSCGFFFLALPSILFFAAFLLLLSFWLSVTSNEQPDADDEDEEDEESNIEESLLEKTFNERSSSNTDNHRRCLPFRLLPIRSRQRLVILVTLLVFVIMIAFAVIIWIGMGKNSIDSAVVARVYVDIFEVAKLLLAGALACYGILLCLKMSKVRSERTFSELWKVAGLAVVSVLCFSSSAIVALLTNIPMLYHWHKQPVNGVVTSLLLILYYFIGSSMPSAFLLWVMREVPPLLTTNIQEESATLTFVSDSSAPVQQPRHWTTVTSVTNQISRASPI